MWAEMIPPIIYQLVPWFFIFSSVLALLAALAVARFSDHSSRSQPSKPVTTTAVLRYQSRSSTEVSYRPSVRKFRTDTQALTPETTGESKTDSIKKFSAG